MVSPREIINSCLGLVPVPGLQPAFTVLLAVWDATQAVREMREQVETLAGEAAELLYTLDAEVRAGRLQLPPPEEKGKLPDSRRGSVELAMLYSLLVEIKEFVKLQASYNLLKMLYRYNDTVKAIEIFQCRIRSILRSFKISTLSKIQDWQTINAEARIKDQKSLNKKLGNLEENQHQLAEQLNLQHDSVMAMMVSLQKSLDTRLVENPRQRKFLTHSLNYLASTSGEQVQVDSWTITSFEVEFGTQIGGGGFGQVFQGTWNKTPVALKVLKDEDAIPSASAIRSEIKAWSDLRHPHVLQFLGANVFDDRPFIVMPYLKNGNARDYSRTHPFCDRIKILHHITLGLVYLHSRHVIHGDLKALNVLIDDAENAVLCDFGLSRVKADATTRSVARDNSVIGSPNWMSPERLLGGALRKPVDIYAFGMTIYEIYTTEVPLGHIASRHYIDLVVGRDVRPERPGKDEAPVLPDEIWELAEQCWAKVPESRPDAMFVCDTVSLYKAWNRSKKPFVERNFWSAEACLDRMNESLRHNICGLPTTSQLDIEIDALTQLIEKHISKDLQYAVMNWMTHILEVQHLTDALMKKLHELLFKHLLHWIEVLSLTRCLDEDKVCSSLSLIDKHISSHDGNGSHSKLCRMIKDVISFLRSYSYPISQAHLHTYISALPLFPSNTLLYQTYITEVTDGRPQVSSNIIEVDLVYFVKRHRGSVRSVALSPSGSQLVSCGEDKTVRICDGMTGEGVHLMKGHSSKVRRAVFSPDGQGVVSCGDDRTICVWNVRTGQLYKKLVGHREWVDWVEISRGGLKLLSHSRYEIMTWKADTGDVIGQRRIKASWATFSPDGQQVAMAVHDKIEIWGIELQHQIAVLDGHKENLIQRVTWSIDGSRLASTSESETLLWDVKQKSLITVLNARIKWIYFSKISANQLFLVINIFGKVLLHIWDINTPNYNHVTKFITHRDVWGADVRLDLGRVVVGTKDGDILMWDIDSLSTLSPEDNLHKPYIITFHEPFYTLSLAHHVDPDGWLCTWNGQKILWVSKNEPPYTIKRTTGRLGFLDHYGKTRLVMESSSIR